MKHLLAAAVGAVALAACICGCGGSDAPITYDPMLIGTWSAQNLGAPSTITFSTNGVVEAVIGNAQDQDSPEHQTGTWYTQGNELVLTSASGKATRIEYTVDATTFTRRDDMVAWTRI